ncbi:hypothetical protein [Pedobacter nototheniae]|uniref:hypothetical protein n=1 Tax=Pedobacter nototheniae TaxID=2488994 RepID=UPI00292DFB40|nr:hypothetical protein [Pedobacter nototheniae]
MKFKVLILLSLATMFVACGVQKPLKFILLKKSKTFAPETNEKVTYWGESYIIENYQNNKYSEKQIDSFAHQLGNLKKDSCDSYVISFYNALDIDNLKYIIKNPQDLDWHDMILEYWWSDHKFLGRTKLKNGKIIDPKNTVIVTDPPPLKQ